MDCFSAEVASLISATIKPSSIACNRSPGFADGSKVLFIASSSVVTSGQFLQTINAKRPSRVSTRGHHQDCRDRALRIATSPANQVVAFASSLKSDLRDRRWIVDQLDSYQVEFSFQGIPPSIRGERGVRQFR